MADHATATVLRMNPVIGLSLGPGANSNNIIIGSEAVQGSGTINLSNTTGSVGAHIRVFAPSTRINICPNCNGS